MTTIYKIYYTTNINLCYKNHIPNQKTQPKEVLKMSTNQNIMHLKIDLIFYTKKLMILHNNNDTYVSDVLQRTLGMDREYSNYLTGIVKHRNMKHKSFFSRWELISYYHHYLGYGVIKTAKHMRVSPTTVQSLKHEIKERIYIPSPQETKYVAPLQARWEQIKTELSEYNFKILF